jgi:hypothetical protein
LELTNEIESSDGKLLYFPWYFGDANMMTLAVDAAGTTPQPVPQMAKIFDQSRWALHNFRHSLATFSSTKARTYKRFRDCFAMPKRAPLLTYIRKRLMSLSWPRRETYCDGDYGR